MVSRRQRLAILALLVTVLHNAIATASPSPITWNNRNNDEYNENEGISKIWDRFNFGRIDQNQQPIETVQSLSFDPANNREESLFDPQFGKDKDVHRQTAMIVEIIVYIVIALVVLSFVGFLICICCPICILAKMRHRRRGHVYARHVQGNAGTTTTITTNSHGPPIIAIPNQRSNAPYPVQESVTVIPIANPRPAPPYAFGPQLPQQPPPNYIQSEGIKPNAPGPMEPPPPYSGPAGSVDTSSNQFPYNPYFEDSQQSPHHGNNILPTTK